MMKLNILNMQNFLQVVDACHGAVRLLPPLGTRQDIRRDAAARRCLLDAFHRGGGALTVTLQAADPSDYMAIVSYYAGDC